MTPLPLEELKRLRELLGKATPGPWEVRPDVDASYLFSTGEDCVVGELDSALDNHAIAALFSATNAVITACFALTRALESLAAEQRKSTTELADAVQRLDERLDEGLERMERER